jgi:hypothetical protein
MTRSGLWKQQLSVKWFMSVLFYEVGENSDQDLIQHVNVLLRAHLNMYVVLVYLDFDSF